jgi:hypothetical protein
MVKRNRIKMVYGIIILVVCALITFAVYIYNDLSELEDAFKATEHSTPIIFREKKQVIFITTRIFGLGGQHFQTVISDIDHTSNNAFIDKEKEIVLDGVCSLYYKKHEPDSLLLFLPLNSYTYKIDNRQIGTIEIITVVSSKKSENFKDLGLIPVNCYDK